MLIEPDILCPPEPLKFKVPVMSCVSSNELPKIVEPDSKSIEALTNSVKNSLAVRVPSTVILPEESKLSKLLLPLSIKKILPVGLTEALTLPVCI